METSRSHVIAREMSLDISSHSPVDNPCLQIIKLTDIWWRFLRFVFSFIIWHFFLPSLKLISEVILRALNSYMVGLLVGYPWFGGPFLKPLLFLIKMHIQLLYVNYPSLTNMKNPTLNGLRGSESLEEMREQVSMVVYNRDIFKLTQLN